MEDRLAHAIKYAQKMKEFPTDFVYFLECQDFVKIGITRNVKVRLNSYKTHNPFKCKLLSVIPTIRARADEELIHTAMEAYHVHGEWFRLPVTLKAYLKLHPKDASVQPVVDEVVKG